MATVTDISCVERIGITAGEIWNLLSDREPLSVSRIVAEMDRPRDHVMQAIGWLAREDKLRFEEGARGTVVTLK